MRTWWSVILALGACALPPLPHRRFTPLLSGRTSRCLRGLGKYLFSWSWSFSCPKLCYDSGTHHLFSPAGSVGIHFFGVCVCLQALTSLMLIGLKKSWNQIELKDVPGVSLRDTYVLFWLERVWLRRPKEATKLEPKVMEQNRFWMQICNFQAPII